MRICRILTRISPVLVVAASLAAAACSGSEPADMTAGQAAAMGAAPPPAMAAATATAAHSPRAAARTHASPPAAGGGRRMSAATPPAAGGTTGATAAQIAGYRLGPGDHVRLIVYGEPNLTGEFAVDGSGQLGVPLIGQVKAGGLTADQLEKEIYNRLSPDYLKNPSVTVEVMTYRPFYIVGEVKNPGSYPYVNRMSVINAVALAGGFTYRAKESDFDITRNAGGKEKKVEAHRGTEVMPGDVITVHERFF